MAGATRRMLIAVLFAGLATVLFASFSRSEFTLTLVLGSLFATAIGAMFLLRSSGDSAGRTGSLGGANTQGEAISLSSEQASLPDPLSMDMDMPL